VYFRVKEVYREPTHDQQTGQEHIYSGTFEVNAGSSDQAIQVAVGIFKTIEQLSSVGWVREIVEVRVTPC
jgi:hypothetical protein